MSNLIPQVTVLDKGLDLQTPKIVAKPGSLLDSLNYEQVDFVGQKRIDGFSRYDGTELAAQDDLVLFPQGEITTVPYDDRSLAIVDGKVWGVQLGVWASPDDELYDKFAVINETIIPAGAVFAKDVMPDYTAHYQELLGSMQELREQVEQLPGAIIGLHWFRDRLYAVADCPVLKVTGTEAAAEIPAGAYVTQFGEDVEQIRVLGAIVSDTFTLLNVDKLPSTIPGDIIYGENSYTVEEAHAGIIASFYESRTEQQVIDEDGPSGPYDFGWRFNNLGWLVPFEDGKSQFGELTSLNQNRQGVGIQGPTSVDGDSGRALTLVQKVNIAGKPTQVNGWKTSTSPTVYNLEASAVSDIDTTYIYADAFFSWDGASGAVTAPGLNDTLIEYPATNTVEVEV